jgi:membrane-bound metal-dependent hydrolase YbcI (DUF457 family)
MGHALGGMAVGVIAYDLRPRLGAAVAALGRRPFPVRIAALCAAIACLPDLDLLVGAHTKYTHSIGSVALVSLSVWAVSRDRRLGLTSAAVYASHLLFDWLSRDLSPPMGIMALWPFSQEHFTSPFPIFEPPSRRYWLPDFWTYNLQVGLTELLFFGSLAALAYLLVTRPRTASR